jgi:hypothetical protein
MMNNLAIRGRNVNQAVYSANEEGDVHLAACSEWTKQYALPPKSYFCKFVFDDWLRSDFFVFPPPNRQSDIINRKLYRACSSISKTAYERILRVAAVLRIPIALGSGSATKHHRIFNAPIAQLDRASAYGHVPS